jgi:hypothetical protein
MNAVFYVIDTHFFGGAWFKWPLLGSAIFLTIRLRNVLAPHDKLMRRRRKEARKREREQRRAARAAWKHQLFSDGQNPSQGTNEFEKVVQTGVAALLEIASRKLDEHAKFHDRDGKK